MALGFLGNANAAEAVQCDTASKTYGALAYPDCIITNFPAPGGTAPDLRYTRSTKHTDPLNPRIAPNFNTMYGMMADPTGVKASDIDPTLLYIQQVTGIPVSVFNAVGTGLYGVRPDQARVQIVTGLTYNVPGTNQGCTGYLYLPPGWSRDPTRQSLLTLEGTGYTESLNDGWFSGSVVKSAIQSVLSVKNGTKGEAIFMVQCGREGLGFAPWTADAVGAFTTQVAKRFNISLKRATLHGVSRGGGEALVWATKLQKYMGISFVAATVPVLSIPDTLSSWGNIYLRPAMAFALDGGFDFDLAHKRGAMGINTSQTMQAALQILCGTTNFSAAKNSCSVNGVYAGVAPDVLAKLQGMQFEITVALVDAFMPNENLFVMQDICSKFHLRCRINVVAMGSHGSNFFNEIGIFKSVQDALTRNLPLGLKSGTFYYAPSSMRVGPDGYTTWGPLKSTPVQALPFTATVPAVGVNNTPFGIEVSGEVGKSWFVSGSGSKNPEQFCVGRFGSPLTSIVCSGGMSAVSVGLSGNTALLSSKGVPDEISWSFGYNSQIIPSTNTGLLTQSCQPVKATTVIGATDPANWWNFFHPFTPPSEVPLRAFGVSNIIIPVLCTPH